MRKSILLLVLLFAIGITANAQKFALIDMEYILKNIPAYDKANAELEKASKQRQTEVESAAEEVKTMYKNYQAKSGTLATAQKNKQEEDIVAKEKAVAELRRKYFGPEGELAKQRENLLKPIQDQIYNVVKTLATQNGYSLVIDRASAASVIFASPGIDISNDVLAKLGYSN